MDSDYAHEILPNLFLGCMWATSEPELAKRRIDCVLNVACKECDANRGQFKLKQWKILPLDDSPHPETVKNFTALLPDALEMIDKCQTNNERLLIHCAAGNSRSAAVVIAWIITRHNISYDDAIKLVLAKRATVKPNTGFVQALRAM